MVRYRNNCVLHSSLGATASVPRALCFRFFAAPASPFRSARSRTTCARFSCLLVSAAFCLLSAGWSGGCIALLIWVATVTAKPYADKRGQPYLCISACARTCDTSIKAIRCKILQRSRFTFMADDVVARDEGEKRDGRGGRSRVRSAVDRRTWIEIRTACGTDFCRYCLLGVKP